MQINASPCEKPSLCQCYFKITVNIDAFPITLSSSKGALMIFAFPCCLVTAACYSQTARFEAWYHGWYLWLQRTGYVWSSQAGLPPQQGVVFEDHFQQHKCIAHATHGSHYSRKAFLHGVAGFPHKPPGVSVRWLNLYFTYPNFSPLS